MAVSDVIKEEQNDVCMHEQGVNLFKLCTLKVWEYCNTISYV
jgi:hypothetical protein